MQEEAVANADDDDEVVFLKTENVVSEPKSTMTTNDASGDEEVVFVGEFTIPSHTTGAKRKRPANSVRKQVRFAAQMEQVFTLDPVDEDSPEEEIAKSSEHATSSKVRRTSQMTILSSLHGRARRELRKIDIFDLQSAVKYGIKSRAHPCRKTGEPRWKYEYANIVYITDRTSTREVTSYKQAITIQEATITPEMWERHQQDSETLRQDPHLCATHSILIVDQSASMRNCDVKGFRTRSEAAYGVLALDYIAEQLHQRGEDSGLLDAVSVIEMNDSSTIVYKREVLDWVLFNKLLTRQKSAKPMSHGNYYSALSAANEVIDWELQNAQDTDIEDLPSYALVFVSDGKPSDKNLVSQQIQLLKVMTNKLHDNFSFHAIGLGQTSADFSALERLADTVRKQGCNGTFAHSSLNCIELSEALSNVATSVTATRLEKVSTDQVRAPRPEKNVQIRSKRLPSSERKFQRHVAGVSRWRYNHKLYEQGGDWPWARISFNNNSTFGFDMEKDPFGKGAERLAYMFHEIDRRFNRVGKPMVAKETLRIDDEERKIKFHEVFCRVQRQANEYAKEFNKAVKKSPQLRPTDFSLRTPDIRFLDCTVYEYKAPDGTVCGVLVEEYLKGKFTKFNGNNGYVKKTTENDRTLELLVGEVFMSDFLQAFSHWVYVHSDHKVLVCDLQGVLHEEGRYPKFQLTDPCIISTQKRSRKLYGKTNIGARGTRAFRKNHKCNGVCKGLGLPPFGMRSQSTNATVR